MENQNEFTDNLLMEELRKRLSEKNLCLQTQSDLVIELEGLNSRLRDSERMKSGFLSNIRNEINNPLTSILGLSAQLFDGSPLTDAKIKQVASLINKEAFSLDFQLRNIFAAAEIEAGELVLQPTMVNIDDLIQNQIDYFQFKSSQHGITVMYEPNNVKYFKTDGILLRSIVMNLLANAIDFSPKNETVNISCQFIDSNLVLEIQDFGKGIDVKDHKNIFDRFIQLDTGTTKTHQGHGLGLSIVQEFAIALGGEIKVNSELNKQTILTLILPELAMNQLTEKSSSDDQEILFGDEEVL